MSRKPPSDAFTRFTSTAPSSSQSQPPPSSSTPSSANTRFNPPSTQSQTLQPSSSSQPSSNPNETPAQRVARLRAAHRAQVASSQLSPVDRLISRGRSFADVAHRVTTYSLLAITGVSTVIAAYGLVSLVSHNRRQKRAWIEREMDRLSDAQKAFLRGEANAEQLHLLEQERAGEEIARKYAEDKKRRKEEGVWHRLKGTFGGFLSSGDMGVETPNRQKEVRDLSQLVEASQSSKGKLLEQGWSSDEIRAVAVQAGPVAGTGLDEKGRPVPINKVERTRKGADESRRQGEKEITARTGIQGGPLDVLADNVVDKASSTSQGWWNWVSGGGRSSPSSAS